MKHLLLLFLLLSPSAVFAVTPACAGFTGWISQTNPATDAGGMGNTNFPEASSTSYFNGALYGKTGSLAVIHGQYPLARFMSLEIYTSDVLVDYISDADIAPDPGQNNPYVSGTANGTFTVYVIFGSKPSTPAPNTLYTGSLKAVSIAYRLYHATDPNDPAAGATNPVTPVITLDGHTLTNCPVQPEIPPDSTPWARLDKGDWIGTPPNAAQKMSVSNPPEWTIKNPDSTHFFPNGADFYLVSMLSREYLVPTGGSNDLFVIRFKAPTFPDTRAGEPVYLERQSRFWSVCTNDPYTTNVNRCIPDDALITDRNGYVTVVISDPGSMPSSAALKRYRASWLAWGALFQAGDLVYDRSQRPWGVSSPVHYYNSVIYRQTLASSAFTQSIAAISLLPVEQQRSAMGAYWPVSGYCTTANFESYGVKCLQMRQ